MQLLLSFYIHSVFAFILTYCVTVMIDQAVTMVPLIRPCIAFAIPSGSFKLNTAIGILCSMQVLRGGSLGSKLTLAI